MSDPRAEFEDALNRIESDAEDLAVARSGGVPVVVMLKHDYDAWREAEHLGGGVVPTVPRGTAGAGADQP
ncbi:PHD/YefM family antitoxin component YafN of YafNO toxin-antitoxin module [Catenuloplanes nepalensis]|uniref:PHD/YefM family antitoxin component YafN of YafNO toxin-antitoxin module n=1 Tax=Catenuloplanes nepalensis TaxID=587533 RepID=A0ABT9MYD7_9ACTN|nr:hypothetical protein [Catenuloplanes nepalensis]MDP9796056.1 PHD/YefM family antitoxin component YafN of YafNO toxin-antitoxin module [Catenuloplanes nepalensis]